LPALGGGVGDAGTLSSAGAKYTAQTLHSIRNADQSSKPYTSMRQ
jgi:hypothetical protein